MVYLPTAEDTRIDSHYRSSSTIVTKRPFINNCSANVFDDSPKHREQCMNADDFTDSWHQHTPHSLFYPATNAPPVQPPPIQQQQQPILQSLCIRASNVSSANRPDPVETQLHQQHQHCNDVLTTQIFNSTHLDDHNRIRSLEQQQNNAVSHHQQQFQSQPVNNNCTNSNFLMPPLPGSLMGITTHGTQAVQLLAAGFPSSFGTSAAPFIPFNLHAMTFGVASSTSTPRLSPPQSVAGTTTILDLDQSASQQQHGKITGDKLSPKASTTHADTPPTLRPIEVNNDRNVGNANGNGKIEAANVHLHAVEQQQRRHTVAHIPTENKVEVLSHTPLCQVCQSGPSNGLHFGAPRTCAACAAFFRRSISDQKKYVCKRPQRCSLRVTDSQGYRKICRNCRMKRCLEIGMMPEKVQHKRHRREVIGVDTFNPIHPPPSHQHKIHHVQQGPLAVISTKLERHQPSSNELTHLSIVGHAAAATATNEELARQHHYANQKLAAAHHHQQQHQLNEHFYSTNGGGALGNPWALTPLTNAPSMSLPQRL